MCACRMCGQEPLLRWASDTEGPPCSWTCATGKESTAMASATGHAVPGSRWECLCLAKLALRVQCSNSCRARMPDKALLASHVLPSSWVLDLAMSTAPVLHSSPQQNLPSCLQQDDRCTTSNLATMMLSHLATLAAGGWHLDPQPGQLHQPGRSLRNRQWEDSPSDSFA